VRIDFRPDPVLYPFTSRWFESSRGRMHYVDEGEGPPILLCHGNPRWSFPYRDIIVALRGRFRCIATDYLGFGLSDRPPGFGYTVNEHVEVLGELVDDLGLDGYLSMGQDWGGPISLGVGVARADRVRGVVLANTWFWPFESTVLRLLNPLTRWPVRQLALRRNAFVDWMMPLATATSLSEDVMRHYRGVQPTAEARLGVAKMPEELTAARPLLEALARKVPAHLGAKPALLVWGMKDFAFTPTAYLPRMRETFHDHVLVELPLAKHFLQEDEPAAIAEAIIQRFG
jgi:haloalkane dehalogenase